MKGNKKISSIFENRHETASQEIFLRSCGFAQRGVPPDSDPSVVRVSPPLNDGIAPRRVSDDSETDSVIGSGYDEALVETHAVRFVSPPESADTVDLEEDAADQTVAVESKVDEEGDSIALEKSANLLSSSRNRGADRLETPSKKLKIPLRDVVKAIVMNSRSTEEEDKEIEKTSCVQILMKKGFKFPGGKQNPSRFEGDFN